MSPTFQPFDWYEDARYYDMVFDADTPEEADFLEAIHAEYGRGAAKPGPARVLEPACGSGRLIAEMARRGWKATGYDLSEGSLRFARERLKDASLTASLSHGSMQSWTSRGKFELAHCLVSTFKFLMTERDAAAHLRATARQLVKGGVYVVGLHLADYTSKKRERERYVAEDGGTHVTCNIQGWPPDAVTRREQLRSRLTIVPKNAPPRYLETHWEFRTYDEEELLRLLGQVPEFEHAATYDFNHSIEHPITFGDYADTVLILRRK